MSSRGMLSGLGQGMAQVGSQWNKQAAAEAAQKRLQEFQAAQAAGSKQHAVTMQSNQQNFQSGENQKTRDNSAQQGLLARQHASQMQNDGQEFTAEQGELSRQHQTDTANPTVVSTVSDEGKRQQVYKAGEMIDEQNLSAEAIAAGKKKDSKPVWDDQQIAKEARAAVRQWTGVESGMVDFTKDMQAESTEVQAALETLAKQQAKETGGAQVDMNVLLGQAVAQVRGTVDKAAKVSAAVAELGDFGAKLAPARYASELADRGLDLPDIFDAMHSNNKLAKGDTRAAVTLLQELGFTPDQAKQALAQMGIK